MRIRQNTHQRDEPIFAYKSRFFESLISPEIVTNGFAEKLLSTNPQPKLVVKFFSSLPKVLLAYKNQDYFYCHFHYKNLVHWHT